MVSQHLQSKGDEDALAGQSEIAFELQSCVNLNEVKATKAWDQLVEQPLGYLERVLRA